MAVAAFSSGPRLLSLAGLPLPQLLHRPAPLIRPGGTGRPVSCPGILLPAYRVRAQPRASHTCRCPGVDWPRPLILQVGGPRACISRQTAEGAWDAQAPYLGSQGSNMGIQGLGPPGCVNKVLLGHGLSRGSALSPPLSPCNCRAELPHRAWRPASLPTPAAWPFTGSHLTSGPVQRLLN